MPLEDAGATVAHPAGWTRMPVYGSPPMVMFTKCDPQTAEGCLVLGEMTLMGPSPGDLADATDVRERQASGAAMAGLYQATERFWEGPHSNHIGKIVKRGRMQIRTNAGGYECMLTATPDLFQTQVGQWREFCASLDVPATTD